jgi:hypothetical protein
VNAHPTLLRQADNVIVAIGSCPEFVGRGLAPAVEESAELEALLGRYRTVAGYSHQALRSV